MVAITEKTGSTQNGQLMVQHQFTLQKVKMFHKSETSENIHELRVWNFFDNGQVNRFAFEGMR